MIVDERRQSQRCWVQFQVSLLQAGVKIGDGTCYGLSEYGCKVASQANIGKGDYVALQLYLPDDQDPITPLMVEVAVVRWTIQHKLGLEFIRLPREDQQRLHQYFKTLQTTSP